MSHVPSDDVKQLFIENKDKNWSGLHKVLQQHKGKAEGIEDSVVSSVIMITRQLEASNRPYPFSAEQLQRVLDEELARQTA